MTITKWLTLYALTVPVFFAIDMLWLGVVAGDTYRKGIGHLIRPNPDWVVAIAFYLIYIVGILFFAVRPGLEAGSLMTALAYGAAFGLFAYMTYDLTNLSTLTGWPAWLSLLDMAWGMVLTGSVSAISFLIGRWLS